VLFGSRRASRAGASSPATLSGIEAVEEHITPERTLQLLEDGSQLTVASVSGIGDPVVLLDARFLSTLKETWRRAKDEAVRLQPTRDVKAMLKLCEEIGSVFEKCEHTVNKYHGGPSPEVRRVELAQIEQELAELRKLLGIDEE
jgi:hypothetical protein